MGRTKGKHLHVLADLLWEHQKAKFGSDYAANKVMLKSLKVMASGKEMNKLAGEITMMVKKDSKPKE